MNEILLSICIPTYNRPNKLKRLLKQIESQFSIYVELVIRDDSEKDETSTIVDNFKKETNIRTNYFRGKKIGLDAANLFLLENANGKFIWYFGDDDERFSFFR